MLGIAGMTSVFPYCYPVQIYWLVPNLPPLGGVGAQHSVASHPRDGPLNHCSSYSNPSQPVTPTAVGDYPHSDLNGVAPQEYVLGVVMGSVPPQLLLLLRTQPLCFPEVLPVAAGPVQRTHASSCRNTIPRAHPRRHRDCEQHRNQDNWRSPALASHRMVPPQHQPCTMMRVSSH